LQLGMKRNLLGLHLLYKFPDAIKGRLVHDHARQVPVVLDLGVDFGALLTHRSLRIRAWQLPVTHY